MACYDSIKELRKNEPKIYGALCDRGLLKKLTVNLKRIPKEKYSDEYLAERAKCYDELKEFYTKEYEVYHRIIVRGLRDKLCGHMKYTDTRRCSDEELGRISSNYTVFQEFREKERYAYRAIARRGLIDKLCGHMKRGKEEYTEEMLAERALCYDDLSEFTKKDYNAYQAILARGLIDKLCGHMKRKMRELTDDEIRAISLRCNTRKEFREKDASAYAVAQKRGILNDVCKHMKRKNAPNGYYTKENCQAVALGYKTKKEFKAASPAVYSAAKRHGWFEDICGHMIPATTDKKRKVYVYTFDDGFAYVGLTDDINRRKREHLGQFREKKVSPVLNHIRKTGAKYEFKELTGWLDLDVVGQVEDDYIKQYAAEGWKMLNRRRGGDLGGRVGIYSPVRIRKIVAGYEYAEDFKAKEQGIYEYLCNNHLYSKYCSSLKHKRKSQNYWTQEKSLEVIPECETRTIFQKRYYQAYRAVKEAGLLDKYFPTLVRPRKWTKEKCIKAARLCKSRLELHKKYPGAYYALKRAGLLDELLPSRKYWEKYNDEEKMKIIARCKTRRELNDNFKSVYDWLRLAGRLDEFFPRRR